MNIIFINYRVSVYVYNKILEYFFGRVGWFAEGMMLFVCFSVWTPDAFCLKCAGSFSLNVVIKDAS